MIRRIALAAGAAGFALSLVGAQVASAAAPMAGTGTVGTCTFTGKAKIKPKLINGGTTTPVITKLKGTLSNCTGGSGDGATVTSGKVKGQITSANNNDCAGLAVNGLAPFTASIKWKVSPGSPKLLPTTVNFAASPPSAINLLGPNGSIQITLTGVNAAGGSFVGNPVSSTATTDEKLADFLTACGAKGLKGFTFTGVNGPSTLSE